MQANDFKKQQSLINRMQKLLNSFYKYLYLNTLIIYYVEIGLKKII